MKTTLCLMIVVCTARAAAAQATAIDRWTPAFPTPGERQAADIASWIAAGTNIALDGYVSCIDTPHRGRDCAYFGARTGLVYGVTFLVKQIVQRDRPCAPTEHAYGCGMDNSHFSFWSAHSAVAFAMAPWFARPRCGHQFALQFTLASTVAGLRVGAGKHWLTDVLAGAAMGAVTSLLRPDVEPDRCGLF